MADWLGYLNLGEHRERFLDNEIDGTHLPSLTKDDYLDLGVTRVGHRMNIERALRSVIDRYQEGEGGGGGLCGTGSFNLCPSFFRPQAVQQPFPYFCALTSGRTDREKDGRRRSELRLQTQEEKDQSMKGGGGVGVNDGGRQLLLSTVDSHNKLRENRFHTEAEKEGGADERTRNKKG